MTEEERLLTKIAELTDARDHLLAVSPTDMVAVQELSERIIDTARGLRTLSALQKIQPLGAAALANLNAAIQRLQQAVAQNQAVQQVMAAVAQVANA